MPESAVRPSAARPRAKRAAWNRSPPAEPPLLGAPNAHLEGGSGRVKPPVGWVGKLSSYLGSFGDLYKPISFRKP